MKRPEQLDPRAAMTELMGRARAKEVTRFTAHRQASVWLSLDFWTRGADDLAAVELRCVEGAASWRGRVAPRPPSPQANSLLTAGERRVLDHVASLERAVRELKERVRVLEAHQALWKDVHAVVDQDSHWIQRNLDVLRRYAGSFVAVDTAVDGEQAVKAHAPTGEEFDTELRRIAPEVRRALLSFHTSIYV
jgi:hypothetical protein